MEDRHACVAKHTKHVKMESSVEYVVATKFEGVLPINHLYIQVIKFLSAKSSIHQVRKCRHISTK